MSEGGLDDKPVAPLVGALLARKGAASADGFFRPLASAPPPAAAPAQRRARILVVEDDLLNRKLMTDLFEAYGYSTREAEDGEAALASARAERPDLIVMDIQLPKLSGVDVIAVLKSDGDLRDVPVIAVTAMLRAEAAQAIDAAGFDGFLAKPFDLENMLQTVSRFLH